MASSNLIKQLQERGLVAQVTDEEALAERLAQGPIALYCGFDPTADSLHLGHIHQNLAALARCQRKLLHRYRSRQESLIAKAHNVMPRMQV